MAVAGMYLPSATLRTFGDHWQVPRMLPNPKSHETSLKRTDKPKKPSVTSTVQALEQAHLQRSVKLRLGDETCCLASENYRETLHSRRCMKDASSQQDNPFLGKPHGA